MRLRVDNKELPGFTSERSITMGKEIAREDVFGPTGEYVGAVAYVRRNLASGASVYGWVPARNIRMALTSKVGAVRRLPMAAPLLMG